MSASFTNMDSESQNRANGNPSRFNALEKRSNPRLITRVGEDRPLLKFLARLIILAVGERDSGLLVARHPVEQDVGLNRRPIGGIFILKAFEDQRD